MISNRYFRIGFQPGLLIFFLCSCLVLRSGQLLGQAVQTGTSNPGPHPRLLLLKDEEDNIRQLIAKDTLWRKVHDGIIQEANAILSLPPVERKMIGRRLLQVSRESVRRIFFLAYSWRMTGEKRYFAKCEEELLKVSAFADWNPSHFLDVAEMTLATAIGYDWLYAKLPQRSRELISAAMIEKGLKPSLDSRYNGWLRASNNWNQVCNAGITFGAIAVYDQQPELSGQLISRAIESVRIPMKKYAPDGNYAEGYSYWAYGTSFNVLLIDALEKLNGTDSGLIAQPGFLKTAAFYENLVGPSRIPFTYGDAGGVEGLQPAMFWFAHQLRDPSLLYIERDYLLRSKFNVSSNRLLPAVMLWAKGVPVNAIHAPADLSWQGAGENQVAVFRTDWENRNGIYVGFKAGSPAMSHAHMDIGSFVMDAEGVRWSSDLGMQQYNSLESAGLDIWNMKQGSQRWEVFRYSNLSHSTLTVNGHLQRANGRATIIAHVADSLRKGAVMDMSALYSEDLLKAQRGIAIVNNAYVTVRDELETGDKACVIRWAMLSPAKVGTITGNSMYLSIGNKGLTLYVHGLSGVKLQSWSTAPPKAYDAPNPGTTLVGFEITVPPHTKTSFDVLLVPDKGTATIQPSQLTSLHEW